MWVYVIAGRSGSVILTDSYHRCSWAIETIQISAELRVPKYKERDNSSMHSTVAQSRELVGNVVAILFAEEGVIQIPEFQIVPQCVSHGWTRLAVVLRVRLRP
jgi:hypothetical protein